MAENPDGSGNGALYFIVGGLVVAVGIFAYIYLGGHIGGHGGTTTIEHTTTTAPATGETTTTTTKKTTNP